MTPPKIKSAGQAPTRLKTQVQQLIPHIKTDDINKLLQLTAKTDIEIVEPPKTGLLMMSLKDCFDIDFYLGEVLITTAEVKLKNKRACATVMGDAPEAAVLLASLELLPMAGAPEILKRVQSFIDTLLLEVKRKKQQEEYLVAATRVEFESMIKEEVDFGSLK